MSIIDYETFCERRPYKEVSPDYLGYETSLCRLEENWTIPISSTYGTDFTVYDEIVLPRNTYFTLRPYTRYNRSIFEIKFSEYDVGLDGYSGKIVRFSYSWFKDHMPAFKKLIPSYLDYIGDRYKKYVNNKHHSAEDTDEEE